MTVEPLNESSKFFGFGIVELGQLGQTLVDVVKPENKNKKTCQRKQKR